MLNEKRKMKREKRQVQFFLVSFLFSVFFFLMAPLAAQAAIVPCGPTLPPPDNECTFQHLATLIINIYNYLLGLAGLVAILFVIYGGFLMVYGWLAEQPQSVYQEGVLTVRRALWGLILIAAAYLVVNTLLTVVLGADNLNTFFANLFK